MKAKSRPVARGFKQSEAIHFEETLTSTNSSFCVHLLNATACELGLNLCHFDVDEAFVQFKLNENVFMRLQKECRGLSGKIVWLSKSLDGLEQALRS